jgi:2,3-bisphosphoglycerate-independent phosphoglycerate mutase
MTPRDVAARANFASMDREGNITDRRAGRIATEENKKLCQKLKDRIQKIEDVEIIIASGKEHRFVVMFRGDGLSDNINDNDPQATGVKALPIKALSVEAEKMARVASQFVQEANAVLKDDFPANTFLVRGIAKRPTIPTMSEAFGVHAVAIATYPMYRGLASLVGMDVVTTGETIADEFSTLETQWKSYDFFYLHIKKTDSYGEDGNYQAKLKIIEEVDAQIKRLLQLNPAVILVTCDHSTPARMKAHSWHPCPLLLWAPQTCQPDDVTTFGERSCMKGGLGILHHVDLMPLMLAHALRLAKYGA